MPEYWIDSDVFIENQKGPYPFEVAPGFWEFLRQKAEDETIGSCKPIYDEILKGNDELVDWVKDIETEFGTFVVPDQEIQAAYADVVRHVTNTYEERRHIDRFLAGADPWIIACAKAKGGKVVTKEARTTPEAKKVKIPNVCNALSVIVTTDYRMLHELGAVFVLA